MLFMTVHLFDAITLNIKRLPKYARLSNGKTVPYSVLLITSEIISLPTAILLDLWAKHYQNKKLPVMQYEFIDMKEVGAFSASFLNSIPNNEAIDLDSKKSVRSLFKFFQQDDFVSLKSEVEEHIQTLNKCPRYLCMTRHLLESLLRSLNLKIKHEKKAIDLMIDSPKLLLKILIYIQLIPIEMAYRFDLWIMPIQKNGIPFLFQDVPHIPAHCEEYL